MPRPTSDTPTFTASFKDKKGWQRLQIIKALLGAKDNLQFLMKLVSIAEEKLAIKIIEDLNMNKKT